MRNGTYPKVSKRKSSLLFLGIKVIFKKKNQRENGSDKY